MKNYLNKVEQNFETLIINRGKNKGIVVLSLDEYNALQQLSMNYLLPLM